MQQTLIDVLEHYDFEQSLLIGYYGGGNYGDELLLEVLQNLFARQNVRNITITYQKPDEFGTFHHDFGYKIVDMRNTRTLLSAIRRNKNMVIGGGGLWGLDVNTNVLALSLLLWVARFALRKKVFLLGVGYYGSTNRLGRVSAWLAGKSANIILARDHETFANFIKINPNTTLDADIATYIDKKIDLKAYDRGAKALEKKLLVKDKTLFISLRRFRPTQQNSYQKLLAECLDMYRDKPIVVALMEPRNVDPEGYRLITGWHRQYKNLRIADFSLNPLALFLFFRNHARHLALIAPQFHLILSAQLNGVPFLPISYDNKVANLLQTLRSEQVIPIQALQKSDVQAFIDNYYKE